MYIVVSFAETIDIVGTVIRTMVVTCVRPIKKARISATGHENSGRKIERLHTKTVHVTDDKMT